MTGSLRSRWCRIALAGAFALVLPAIARAQSGTNRPVIRAVVIDRAEVFDSAEVKQFWGFGLVNALHARTKLYVIRRELLFSPGEPYDTARANESARNLRALA